MSPGSTVLRVRATDPDDGDNGAVKYQLSAASLAHYGHVFSVDNSSGDVIVVGAVDYERILVYHLVVCAVDSGPELVTSSDVVVVIKVEDVNDNAPIVLINTLTASGTDVASVPENSPTGTFVGHVMVSDPDSGRNAKTNCTLVPGPTDNTFRLERLFETEYQLVTVGRLDRETTDCYTVHLNCTDQGRPPMATVVMATPIVIRPPMATVVRLTIHISDVNDHTPRFTAVGPIASLYVADLLENNYIGAYVTQVSAVDSDINDNAVIRYLIADVQPETTKDSTSGGMTRDSWDEGRDGRDGREDEEDRESQIAEETKKDRASGKESRRQGQGQGTGRDRKTKQRSDVRKETARQQQGAGRPRSEVDSRRQIRSDQGRRTVSKDCWANFNVNSMTGMITTKTVFDYETTAVFNCRLLAVDNGTPPRTGEADLMVNIIDVNDERPEFQQSHYIFHVSEHVSSYTEVGTVSAVDRDEPPYNTFSDVSTQCIPPYNTFTLSLKSNNEIEDFIIDPKTGRLSTIRPLDREIQSAYQLLVVAIDTQDPRIVPSTATITVVIDDINDNSPIFVQPAQQLPEQRATMTCFYDVTVANDSSDAVGLPTFFVAQTAIIGSKITTVKAVDADSDSNSRITYRLQINDQQSENMFRIEPEQGTILLASGLTPRDVNNTYHVTVFATDGGIRRLSSSVDLCIQVAENQLRPATRQGDRLLSQLVLSRSLLVTVVLLGVLGTIFILLFIVCLIRRLNTRCRHGFKRPSCVEDKYTDEQLGQYNCRSAALQSTNGCRQNGGKLYVSNDSCKWNQLDHRLASKCARHADCHDDNDVNDRWYRPVIRSLESSPRRQVNGQVHSKGVAMTTFGIASKRAVGDSQQQRRYQTLPSRPPARNCDDVTETCLMTSSPRVRSARRSSLTNDDDEEYNGTQSQVDDGSNPCPTVSLDRKRKFVITQW